MFFDNFVVFHDVDHHLYLFSHRWGRLELTGCVTTYISMSGVESYIRKQYFQIIIGETNYAMAA